MSIVIGKKKSQLIVGGADTPSDALRKAKQYTDARIAEIETFKKEVVPSLESITNPNTETLYLVPIEDGAGNQYCDEYFYFLASGDIPAHFEKVGSTDYTPDIAIEDKPSLNKLLVTLNPFNPQTKSQFLVARDPYDTPDAPTFSPATGGSGNGSLTVNISCTSSNVDIKYSLDNGATWTTGTSVTLSQDVNQESKSYTLKAKAVNKTSLLESDVASASFTVKRKVATPVLNPATNTYNATQSVAITCDTSGATIYYTTDGTDPVPSEAGQEGKATKTYSSAISVTKTGTVIKAIATKTQWVDSAQNSATYTIKVKTPSITLSSGNKYSTSRTVTLACDTANLTGIYYTTNGTTPNPNEADQQGKATKTYSAPFTLNAGTYNIWVLAKKTNWANSDVKKENNLVIGTKKCYIGGGSATLSSLSGLTGIEEDQLSGSYSVTLASDGYIWFVVPSGKTITSITSGPLDVPFSLKANSVSGYNCYRTDNEIAAGTHTFNIS